MSNFTPGPWLADEGDDHKTIYPREGSPIAHIGDHDPNWLNNAYLIAAAPDIYKALARYVKEYGEWEKAVCTIIGRMPETGVHLAQAIAALAKADGK